MGSSRSVLIFVLTVVALGACQTKPERPPLLVSEAQSVALNGVFDDVITQLTRRGTRNLVSDRAVILELVSREDPRIQAILTPKQWTDYDAHHREYFVDLIYRQSASPTPQNRGLPIGGFMPGLVGRGAGEGPGNN